MESVLMGHRNALKVTTAEKAAHSIAPQLNSEFTPVITTSGADDGTGKKSMTTSDILTLKRRFDEAEIPLEQRFLILNPKHASHLLAEDIKLYKDISNYKEGQIFKFAGFSILEFSRMPKYNATTNEKKAFGSAPAGTDTDCSIAFSAPERL